MNAARFLLGYVVLAMISCPALALAEDKCFFALLTCQEQTNGTCVLALVVKTTNEAGSGEDVLASTSLVSGRVQDSAHRQFKSGMPLAEFLAWAHATQVRLTIWGPYPVDKSLYDRTKAAGGNDRDLSQPSVEKDSLRAGDLSNYLDAIAGMPKNLREPRSGDDRTCLLIVRGLKPWFLPPGNAPDWLLDRLQLAKYGVTQMTR
jgi:hypothetical protein